MKTVLVNPTSIKGSLIKNTSDQEPAMRHLR
jgi:hypothetical protein